MVGWKSDRFAILMPWGRVGSNLVVKVLLEQTRVKIVNEPSTVHRSQISDGIARDFDIDLAQTDYLRKFSRMPGKAGLKLSHRSFMSPMMAYDILKKREFRIVAMDRDNHLKSAISQIRADQLRTRQANTGFAVPANSDRPAPTRIPVQLLLNRMESFRQQSGLMTKYIERFFGEDHLAVTYEDLARDPAAKIRQIADYLEVPLPAVFDLPYAKATSDNLKDDVINYEEIVTSLKDTEFASFITD